MRSELRAEVVEVAQDADGTEVGVRGEDVVPDRERRIEVVAPKVERGERDAAQEQGAGAARFAQANGVFGVRARFVVTVQVA